MVIEDALNKARPPKRFGVYTTESDALTFHENLVDALVAWARCGRDSVVIVYDKTRYYVDPTESFNVFRQTIRQIAADETDMLNRMCGNVVKL